MIVNNIGRSILKMLILLIVIISVFFVNIILHEAGHFVAAEYYGLEPEINYNFETITAGFGFGNVAVASTSFLDNGNINDLFVISVFGPFVNLFIGLVCYCANFFSRKRIIKEIMLISYIISFASFVMNIIPIEGSDGALALSLLG